MRQVITYTVYPYDVYNMHSFFQLKLLEALRKIIAVEG